MDGTDLATLVKTGQLLCVFLVTSHNFKSVVRRTSLGIWQRWLFTSQMFAEMERSLTRAQPRIVVFDWCKFDVDLRLLLDAWGRGLVPLYLS